jgi:hypothetical protein
MATPTAQAASQVIADALVEINVVRDGETPSAEMQARAIRALNKMMALWEADGRSLGYVPIGTVTDIMTVPDAALVGIYSSLAIMLAPGFGATVSPELVAVNEKGMAVIDKITAQQVLMEMDLPCGSHCGTFNINTG